MFVGQTGVARVIKRTCEVMNEHQGSDPAEHGAIPLELIQRYINYWASSSLDLFGAEVSSNSANFFASGLKGRAFEEKYDEHTAVDQGFAMERWKDGQLVNEEVPLRNAMNEVLREAYIADNQKGIEYWNRECERAHVDFRFTYPHRRFNRTIGEFAAAHFDPSGQPLDAAAFQERRDDWLPTVADRAYVKSLMSQVTERGKFAGWIAPPLRGIDSQEIEFEYVRL